MKANLLFACLASSASAVCLAVPPDACTVISLDEVNTIAAGAATKISPRKSGNPTSCAFEDPRRAVVLLVKIREVQYAAENELQYERENLEKIYRQKVEWVDSVGDRAFWLQANRSGMFRKGKLLVTVTFSREKNANRVDTMQAARLVESRLK